MKYNSRIKNFRYYQILFVLGSLLLLFTNISYAQNKAESSDGKTVSILINQLEESSLKEVQETVMNIYALGKEAIPNLIENINNKRRVSFILKNPRNSILSASQLRNSSGLTSAYLIEIILGSENFSISDDYFVFGDSKNYVYWHGIIVDSSGKPIKESDLIEIKLQYKDWWSENRDKSIEILRKEWSENKEPLSKSEYKWQ